MAEIVTVERKALGLGDALHGSVFVHLISLKKEPRLGLRRGFSLLPSV